MNSTDPADELFDILSEDGTPLGLAKPRAAVHRDGDWHRAFHLWLAWLDERGQARVLFQRRASGKDTWPGRLDVAVGGHYRAGEGVQHVVREVGEELGVQPHLDQLVPAGTRRTISLNDQWQDRELQDVHVWILPGPPPGLRPDPVELAAVYQVAVADLGRLFEAGVESIPALEAAVNEDGLPGPWVPVFIPLDDFVPVRDHYWLRGARLAGRLLAGQHLTPEDLFSPF